MATLIAAADGNLTGSTTFAAAEAGALAMVLNRNISSNAFAAAGTSTSVTFTVTNGKVIDGVLLWLSTSTVATGTFKVDLQKGGVSQASVTVNKADIPSPYVAASISPILFKLTTTATGDGAANWTIVVTTTGSQGVQFASATASTTNWTRALRTTTTQAPVATDDLYVVGELTGAGTKNTRTVTMDSTAATVYGNGAVNSTTVNGGGVHISNWGTLTYGTIASTAYILRVAGDVIVYQYGALNIVSPQTSTTQVLEFQPVSADGDFGLRCLDNSTVTITGQPRTAGTSVVKCKLTADVAGSSVINNFGSPFNGTNTVGALDASGNSLLGSYFTDNTTNGMHYLMPGQPSPGLPGNTTLTTTIWLARGSGLNNRYVRLTMGSSASLSSNVNGYYSDIDLQAGTAGTVTAVGTGTATSVSIVPEGRGYLIKMTGKGSSSASPTSVFAYISACSAPGTLTYAGNTTSCFHYDHIAIVAAASISDTTFNVDTDTGWLSGDAVCVASTTRTASECEIYPLNANAGASSFTSALYPFTGAAFSTHHGTAPIQAEIGLLTRNVKIRSTSTTLMSYVYCTALSTVTASWAEFYYVGASGTGKRGIEIDGGAVCNPKSFTYCSIHDCDNNGFYCAASGVISLNVTFSNNVVWNSLAQNCLIITGAVTNTDWTFNANLVMRTANAIALNDLGGAFTNNTMVGSASTGVSLLEPATILGAFDGNVSHSNAAIGLSIGAANLVGTISNFNGWRNTGSGVGVTGFINDLVFTNLTLFGNSTTTAGNFAISNGDTINIKSGTIAGDTSFPVQYGFNNTSSSLQFNLSSVDMSGIGSIFAPHTVNDFFNSTAASTVRGVTNNCKFGAPNLISSKTTWSSSSNIGFQKFNQTSGDHRTEMTYGQLRTDSAVFHTAAPSMKMTPNNASNRLESAPKNEGILAAVNSGDTVTASVWVRKDATYFGSQPRLIVRANAAIGVNADTVLATATGLNTTVIASLDGTVTGLIVMSNNNLTATLTSTSNASVSSRTSTSVTTGKYYFEITAVVFAINSLEGFGIALPTASHADLTSGLNCTKVALNNVAGAKIFSNNVDTGKALGNPAQGDVYSIAIDLDARLGWFRRNGGNWNGDAAANPATGAGGVTIASGAFTPVVYFQNNGNGPNNSSVANFGATTFAYAAPSGFGNWLVPPYTGTATWVQLSGTTPAATGDDGVMEFIVDCDGTSGFVNVDDWSFA